MKKLFNLLAIVFLAMIMTITACGRKGGDYSDTPRPTEPRYDITGYWEVAYYPKSYITQNDHFEKECSEMFRGFLVELNEDNSFDATQNGLEFSLTFINSGQHRSGTIIPNIEGMDDAYSIEDTYLYYVDGLKVRQELSAELYTSSDIHFAGTVEYDIHVESYGYVCTLQYGGNGEKR